MENNQFTENNNFITWFQFSSCLLLQLLEQVYHGESLGFFKLSALLRITQIGTWIPISDLHEATKFSRNIKANSKGILYCNFWFLNRENHQSFPKFGKCHSCNQNLCHILVWGHKGLRVFDSPCLILCVIPCLYPLTRRKQRPEVDHSNSFDMKTCTGSKGLRLVTLMQHGIYPLP